MQTGVLMAVLLKCSQLEKSSHFGERRQDRADSAEQPCKRKQI